jgi:succinate-semialdehyde dehydrogenase/glutarate-semialdehyde dehydrogenase
MVIRTFNPFTQEKLAEYEENTPEELTKIISVMRQRQKVWGTSIEQRIQSIREAKKRFEKGKNELATLMSREMGKPVSQSISEVEKCIWLMDYMTQNAEKMLEPEAVHTEATRSYIRFDPLGVILLIMPWNFPAWQVVRAGIPALMAGNGVILKHASIVTGTSLKLEELLGLDVFKSVVARGETALSLIEHVDGVSFTGSTGAGSKIAETAGRNIKKFVLELGGSDPFIVLKSADLEATVRNAVFARLQNNGQSCIASKRFIVHQDILKEFYTRLREEFARVKVGDPLKQDTFLGPLSSAEQKSTVARQLGELSVIGRVERVQSIDEGNFIPPSLALTDTSYTEEVFGPVAIVKGFRTPEEALALANETPFGLGASVWGDRDEAEALIPGIQAGMVFVNKVVASDPRLPFGGVKKSGIGRELSRYGLLEFTNIRSVWVS